MISNDDLQVGLVAFLQADSSLVAFMSSSGEIKEDQYQGTVFAYPATRVALDRQVPQNETDQCVIASLTGSVRCFAEGASSRAANQLSALVQEALHKQQLSSAALGADVSADFFIPRIRVTASLVAVRTAENLWRAEVFFSGNVNGV